MQQVLRTKRPLDRLDYDVDFSRWLSEGDSITGATATVTTTGAVEEDGVDWTTTHVKVWLKDGTDGETAHVEVTATTLQGRTKDICFQVRVREGC